MSGGKETPRQKMIGMMYLVLTALLALNVSNAVLEKFAIIDDTLSKAVNNNNGAGGTNEGKLAAILNSKVEDKTGAKVKAQKVRDLTKATIAYMDDLKKKLSSEQDGKLIERTELVTNTNNAEEIMINHNKPEVGTGYEKKLNGYVNELNQVMGIKPPFTKLTKTALDYDEFKESTHKDKPFLEFAFEGVPTMAAVATISETQSEILGYEAVALDSLKRRVSAAVYEVDQLVPMVQAEANSLVAGTTYEGKLFVAGSASGVNPEMFFGNSPLKVQDENIYGIKVKMGTIKFPVRSAATYDKDGVANATFHVRINLPGRAQPIETDVKYKILRPSPRFASAASSTLYINCGNEVNVTIPGLTDVSGLELSVPATEGSKVKLGPGKFAIIPSRPQCHVSVLLDGVNVYTETFTTKEVPIPIARVMYGNTAYSDDLGLPPGTANIRIEPEIIQSDFVQNNKKDANYIVQSFTLLVKGSPVPIRGGSLNLAAYNLRSGDSFTITNVKVSRSTYDGRTVEVLGNRMSKVVKIK
ncbi:MAG TPA: GldM family protein [Cyclobacteriaceae bacterium]|nr:GldM family protein [Cyclobacteriaceae bacterium]